jgi:hypothetical protein
MDMFNEIKIDSLYSALERYTGKLTTEDVSDIYSNEAIDYPVHRSWLGYFVNPSNDQVEFYDQLESLNEMGSIVTTKALIKNQQGNSTRKPIKPDESNCYIISIGRNHLTGLIVKMDYNDRTEITKLHLFAAGYFKLMLDKGLQDGLESATLNFITNKLNSGGYEYSIYGNC